MTGTSGRLQSRLLDITILLVVATLFYEGYAKSHFFGYERYSVLDPILILSAFIAAFYPFRPHTRVLWLIVVPFAAAVIPMMGFNVHMRLNSAPGHEIPSSIANLVLAYALFLISTIICLAPAFLGWTLRHGKHKVATRRTMGLQELFALTGIACVLMILFRDSFATNSEPSPIAMNRLVTLPSILLRPAYWLFFVFIAAGFYFNWRAVVAIWLLVFAGVSMYEWHVAHEAALASMRQMQAAGFKSSDPQFISQYQTPYWRVARFHAWQLTVLVGAICAGRVLGYRLVYDRRSQPNDSEMAIADVQVNGIESE